jgi:hypothetical protein
MICFISIYSNRYCSGHTHTIITLVNSNWSRLKKMLTDKFMVQRMKRLTMEKLVIYVLLDSTPSPMTRCKYVKVIRWKLGKISARCRGIIFILSWRGPCNHVDCPTQKSTNSHIPSFRSHIPIFTSLIHRRTAVSLLKTHPTGAANLYLFVSTWIFTHVNGVSNSHSIYFTSLYY